MANATIAQKYSTNPRNIWSGAEKIPLDVSGADGVGLASGLRDYVGQTFKTKLTANISFYVATTGNDTTGTGASGTPWATPQKAWNYCVTNLDLSGFTVTINLAAGTYQPLVTDDPVLHLFGTPVGEGTVKFVGQASDRTLVRFYNPSTGNGRVVDSAGNFQYVEFWYIQFFQRADQTNYNKTLYFWGYAGYYYLNSCDLGPCAAGWVGVGNRSECLIDGTYSILGGAKDGGFTVSDGGIIWHYANATIPAAIAIGSSDPTYYGFINVHANGTLLIYPGLITGVSNVTGLKYNVGSGAFLSVAANTTSAVHLSDLPGSLSGLATFGSFLTINGASYSSRESMLGINAKVGLPTTTDLEPAAWGLFKNTSDGKVYLAINDTGTIKKVELT